MNLPTIQKVTRKHRKRTHSYQQGKDYWGLWERHVHTALDACVYLAETLHCSHNTTMTLLLIGYAPIQNKKLKQTNRQHLHYHICPLI